MKQLLLFILAALCCLPTFADNDYRTENKKQRIILIGRNIVVNRDLSENIDAFLDMQSQTIELSLSDIGMTEIYIVDSGSKEVSHVSVDSSVEQFVILDIPQQQGHYTLVVWSPAYYGEGVFNKN